MDTILDGTGYYGHGSLKQKHMDSCHKGIDVWTE